MSQEQNNQDSYNDISGQNNYMSTIQTYIKHSSYDFNILKPLYELDGQKAAKLELKQLEKKKSSLDQIQATFFDKIIFSLIQEEKMSYEDYSFLFYIFFIREHFRTYYIQFGHKNLSKFFKKFFNACMNKNINSDNIFTKYEIGEFINFYLRELFKLITGDEKIKEIKSINDFKLSEKEKKINLKNLDSVDIKYMKHLVKYILSFSNILNDKKYYKGYHLALFQIFIEIKDKIFQNYFKKQLYKIFINKGIYRYGNYFALNLFYPLISQNDKFTQYEFNLFTFNLIDSILSYKPIYYLNNNNNKINYSKGSPYHFLNIVILIKIMDDLLINKNIQHIMLFKFLDGINSYINLFIDDNSQIKVAELILTDTINKKLIMNNLEKIELIKYYINNIDIINNNAEFWQYFEYIFFDLSKDIFMSYYYNNKLSQKNNNKTLSKINNQFISSSNTQSQDINSSSFNESINNINSKKEKFDYNTIIINKFITSQDYFIRKYFFNDLINEDNIDIILSQKKLEELFVLLDIIYDISIRFEDDLIVKKSIEDIKKIIIYILKQSYEESTFNCAIHNFILNINNKYLPSPDDFNIIKINQQLFKISKVQFIITYPSFIIFILNFFPNSNDYNIKEFSGLLNNFINGYLNNVFGLIDTNIEEFSHKLQLNYVKIIYFIIRLFLNIHLNKINEENINTKSVLHLPYCFNCKKKLKNSIILSKNLSQCFYCGEKNLYLNAYLIKYLIQNKNILEIFSVENIIKIISKLTCNILIHFKKKLEKTNEISLFCYFSYYKLMQEHFQFLNEIQFIIGQNIPFNENEIGNLEENINEFFDNYVTNKSKYPFDNIYRSFDSDRFIEFNTYRKTIKHESLLQLNRYIKK